MKLKRDYRISRARFEGTKKENQMGVVLDAVWRDVASCSRRQRATLLKRLTPGQRSFLAIQLLEGEVCNGGLQQFLENSSGDFTDEVLLGLRRIGAKLHLARLRSVVKRFPKHFKLSNRRHRQAWMKGCSGEQMDVLFNDYFFRLEKSKRTQLETWRWKYCQRHREEFVLPDHLAEEVVPPPQAGGRDYRIPARRAKGIGGQKLHWTLIAKLWDDYFLALKAGETEFSRFVESLSPGLRALTVLDLLHKTILNLEGFSHFLGHQLRSDLLVTEVKAGYELLNASHYGILFARVLETAGDLPALNSEVTSRSQAYAQAKGAGDATAIEVLGKQFREAYTRRQKRLRELDDPLVCLSEELKGLLASPQTSFEPCVEAYLVKNPDDFFR